MDNKQGNQGECAIVGVKSVGWFDMVFEGAVESFDELFVGSELFRLAVEILKADDLSVL